MTGFTCEEERKWEVAPYETRMRHVFAALMNEDLRHRLADSLTEFGGDYSTPCDDIRDAAIKAFLDEA